MSKIFVQKQDFCAICGTILPLPLTAPCIIKCALCLKEWEFQPQIDQLVNHQEKIYERTIADIEVQRIEDTEVDHICPKCGHGKATYSTQQTRSADEGQTVFYTCTKCKQKSIEYS
uniref:DNA-directed RNA polymerase subunit n=1 Tax=Acrobeloides nanus TaxID=290746 RepID=A0A914EPR8_9BILA